MSIRVECNRCGTAFKARDEFAGRTVKCKICQASLKIPAAADESPQIIRHQERKKPLEIAYGDEVNIARIDAHIQKHLGPIETVYHELISDLVHIDVHFVAATRERPCQTLVTSGMSDRPMTVPDDADSMRFAELFLSLPPDWPLDMKSLRNERNYWPIRWLKTLARFPHEYDTWLSYGHSIPNGNPPIPVADDTRFCGFVLGPPVEISDEFIRLDREDQTPIWMWALYPLYREEIDFKLQQGADALIDRLRDAGVTERVDVGRKNVCKKRTGWS